MRKVIHKCFFVWNFDKEEKWLCEMAAKGFVLVRVGFCRYEFEKCDPGEYDVRLQLLNNRPNHPESQHYISFVEETGAEHVGSYCKWVYFRKKTSEGAFELFSDFESRIKQLNRIILMIIFLVAANLYIGMYNLFLLFFYNSELNSFGFVNLALGLIGSFGIWKLLKKRKKLKNDNQIFE